MSEFQKVFTIILSSPGDVNKEREIVVQSVQEINLTLQKYYNALIELRKWETHSKPSAKGKYSQEIINIDLGDDFDIYLGIMWTKFGTPTPNAGSGTEEEFNHAFELLKAEKNIDIMFYFSQRKQQPEKSLQMGKVLAFKERIRDLNVFTWDYKSLNDFSYWIRLHLSHKIYDLLVKSSAPKLLQDYRKAIEINDRVHNLTVLMGNATERLGAEANKFEVIQEKFHAYFTAFQSEIISIINQRNKSLLLYKLKSFNDNVRKIFNEANVIMDNLTKIFVEWLSLYSEAIFLIPQSPVPNKIEIIGIAYKALYVLINGFTKTMIEFQPMEEQALGFIQQNPLPQINDAFYKFHSFVSSFPKTFNFYLLLVKNVEIKLSEIKETILLEEKTANG